MRKQNCNFPKVCANQARPPKNIENYFICLLCVSWCPDHFLILFKKKRWENFGFCGPTHPPFGKFPIFFFFFTPSLSKIQCFGHFFSKKMVVFYQIIIKNFRCFEHFLSCFSVFLNFHTRFLGVFSSIF